MPAYLDFVVSLQNVLPRPWRRFLLPTTSTFAGLSDAIQAACGWAGSHLYEFRASGAYDQGTIAALVLGDGEDEAYGGPVPEARRARLGRYFGADRATSCLYFYDFGDGWVHDVQLYDVVTSKERRRRRLLGGEHAFPPDDCGGVSGYAALQHALRTGHDPEGMVDRRRMPRRSAQPSPCRGAAGRRKARSAN